MPTISRDECWADECALRRSRLRRARRRNRVRHDASPATAILIPNFTPSCLTAGTSFRNQSAIMPEWFRGRRNERSPLGRPWLANRRRPRSIRYYADHIRSQPGADMAHRQRSSASQRGAGLLDDAHQLIGRQRAEMITIGRRSSTRNAQAVHWSAPASRHSVAPRDDRDRRPMEVRLSSDAGRIVVTPREGPSRNGGSIGTQSAWTRQTLRAKAIRYGYKEARKHGPYSTLLLVIGACRADCRRSAKREVG